MTLTARDRILDTALATFNANGLIGASIGAISKGASTSVGGVYHHFEGKERLAGAVYVAALADFQRAFATVVTTQPEAEPGVRAGVGALLRWCLRDQPGSARFLLTAPDAARGAAQQELEELNRGFFAAILAWWRPHVRGGALRDLDFDLAHAVWLGPGLEYCRLHLAGRTEIPDARAEHALADAAWNALRQGDA